MTTERQVTTTTAWPADDRAALDDFYGAHALGTDNKPTARWESEHLETIELPFAMRLDWEQDTAIHRARCNRLIAAPLRLALLELLDTVGARAIREAGLDLFGGIYNYRPIRGTTTGRLSVHSWGAAIDLAPSLNPLGKPYDPRAGMIPLWAVRVLQKHGAVWGGTWRRPDAQHFQWTEP